MIFVLAFLLFSFDYAIGIKGGQNAKDVVPYMASLQIDGNHLCGGVIVSSKWVLSSALYTQQYDYEPSQITVVVGIVHLTERGQSFTVDKILIHGEYYNLNNDLSMVRVSGEMKFNENVAAINLPQGDTEAGTKVVVSGFGRIELRGENVNMLQTLNMTTLSVEECNSLYKRRSRPLTKEQICAVGANNGSGVCNGDEGGPLYIGNKLVGVVSGANRCVRNTPSIFTNIYYYKKWIQENMK